MHAEMTQPAAPHPESMGRSWLNVLAREDFYLRKFPWLCDPRPPKPWFWPPWPPPKFRESRPKWPVAKWPPPDEPQLLPMLTLVASSVVGVAPIIPWALTKVPTVTSVRAAVVPPLAYVVVALTTIVLVLPW